MVGRLDHYVRIWADPDGESHLEDVSLDGATIPAERGVPQLWWSEGVPADRVHFVTVSAVARPDWHCAPRRQFVVFLTGGVRITASDGDERHLPTGSVVLAEDLTGRGHVTEHEAGDQDVLVIALDRDD